MVTVTGINLSGATTITFGSNPVTPISSTSTSVSGLDGVNLVVFRGKLCSDVPCAGNACATANNCWDHGATGTIALTTVTFVASSGQIVDADMEVYGWNGSTGGATGLPTGYYLTCATPTSPACASRFTMRGGV